MPYLDMVQIEIQMVEAVSHALLGHTAFPQRLVVATVVLQEQQHMGVATISEEWLW